MRLFIKIFILLIIISFIFYTPVTFAELKVTGRSGGVELDNPLGDTDPPQILIGKIINAALGVVGSLALVMFIYGGLVWMTAAGNDQRIQTGKSILTWAVIGLIIIFTSYALVNFVFTSLGAK